MKHLRSTLRALCVLICGLFPRLIFAGPLPNAWQITDNSSSGASGGIYDTNLSGTLPSAALSNGWHFTLNARLVTDFDDTATMVFFYGVGTNRFSVYLDLDANNDLTATPYNQPKITLTTNGTGFALYHTHEIIYNPTNRQAAYLFDGVQQTTWGGDGGGVTAPNGQIEWGSGSTAGRGQMNFHAITFAVGTNVVAAYDAGTENNPTNAPDPRSKGWTVNPATGAKTNAVSPDRAVGPAITLAANQFAPGRATLNGLAGANGLPTTTWFAWGASTNYDNTTTPQTVGNGTNPVFFSDEITNLNAGVNYHFSAVVSNASGVVTGADQSFLQPGFLQADVPNLPGVYDSSVAWGDYDNDGRLDFLLTGTTDGWYIGIISQMWRNTGNGFSNVTTSIVAGLPGVAVGSTAWGDYDNDGRLDFLITGTIANTALISQLWRNTGSGFTNVPIAGLPGVDRSSVAWGDYDNDGWLDLLLTGTTNDFFGGAVSQLWRNTGNGFSNVTASVAPSLPGVYYSSVAWGDYDNDGRLDFLLTGSSSTGLISQVWRNTGSGFSNVTANVAPGPSGVYYSSVAWGDYDNDGRLDFLLTGSSSTGLVSQVWRNTGSGFSNVTAGVAPGLPGVFYSSVAWGDYDNDGWLDFLITGRNNNGTPISQLWRNTGGGFSNVTASVAPGLSGVYYSSVAWGDYDNDGRLDFLITGSGISQLWRNNVLLTNAPPSTPASLGATFSATTVALNWNSPTDDHTSATGLNFNLRIGSSPGASDVLSPMSLSNGLRLLPALGKAQVTSATFSLTPGRTYYWSVQAIDTSFAGSPFAAEQQFYTPPRLINLVHFPNGIFEFNFTNQTVLNFDILVSTNAALPLNYWTDLGPALPLGGGLYRFTDVGAIGQPQRFYLLRQQ